MNKNLLGGMFKIAENWKLWVWGLLKILKYQWDGPPPQQGASEHIRGLTG